jgi:hydroxymethylpyrimidine/phosphomethylpyrimidine kinase
MSDKQLSVLSIAGFDPSAGAGILADIKTFESLGIYGTGICSAITFQNDISFEGVEWVKPKAMEEQFRVLSKRFRIGCVKIGLIENLNVLKEMTVLLKQYNEEIKIIWDPILKASAGFQFHHVLDRSLLEEIYKDLYLVTPNLEEIRYLFPNVEEEDGARYISQYCNVLLKGGHRDGPDVRDMLFEKEDITDYRAERIVSGAKHGSGCVLSASITGYLAQGLTLKEACGLSRQYMNAFLSSSDTLLGWHGKQKEEPHAG